MGCSNLRLFIRNSQTFLYRWLITWINTFIGLNKWKIIGVSLIYWFQWNAKHHAFGQYDLAPTV
ncbi:hypothetical protein MsedE_1213 [Metallosphaera sedula]|uniref:Uncharacterized protein n=1 Tax=Metallosphaera sedula TaxID=43687 RepID=A0A0K1T8H6_9CREN|nr:hypothetical protein MsedE_1213 [Metallosphaera sedula]